MGPPRGVEARKNTGRRNSPARGGSELCEDSGPRRRPRRGVVAPTVESRCGWLGAGRPRDMAEVMHLRFALRSGSSDCVWVYALSFPRRPWGVPGLSGSLPLAPRGDAGRWRFGTDLASRCLGLLQEPRQGLAWVAVFLPVPLTPGPPDTCVMRLPSLLEGTRVILRFKSRAGSGLGLDWRSGNT